jgi:predicted Zn-dependent peptidase
VYHKINPKTIVHMLKTNVSTPRFQTVPNDPFGVRLYQMKNGLKLYLCVNKNEPRIHTNIAVATGSKQDPAEFTGLAHYMEHLLFKGTSRIGSLNWEKEQVYLQQISDLYEQHRKTADQEERAAIYREIDRLSFEAAKLVAPSEYDKLATSIGAKGTNAYTWVEQTVYVNDIPSNELERWMELESERFRMLTPRLFHTELETVYEEFNISQDRDARKLGNALRAELFKKHPYGTQTTIGRGEHLKTPSLVKLQEFYTTYYVPNNMAVILAGDFDPERAVALAEQYFGDYPFKPIPPFSYEPEPPIDEPRRREVWGQEAPYVDLGWRFDGANREELEKMMLLRGILYNEQAGLLDLNLNQQQRVLESNAWHWIYADYSAMGLYGKPREGQTLEEVEELLLQQIDKLHRGEFEDWLPQAIIREHRLDELKAMESNRALVDMMTHTFILGMPWEDYTQQVQRMEKVTKDELVDYARKHLRRDNYVVIYKRQGEDPNVMKVAKPPITPVEINRAAASEFAREFLGRESRPIAPQFVDFQESIHRVQLKNGLQLDYVANSQNELFRLDYIFEMGKLSDRKLALALLYLPYLGADRYSPSQLQQEFYRLGLTFDVFSNDYQSYLSLSGLEESLEEGVQLLEHVLHHAAGNAEALRNVVSDILMKRANAKKDKNFVLRQAMASYARYGSDSPFNYRLSAEELRQLQPEELVSRIHSLSDFERRIYYYGQMAPAAVARILERTHRTPERLKGPIPAKPFGQAPTDEPQVLLFDFPIVQSDALLISRGSPQFNLEEHLLTDWYNEYFGYGLSSIVFQEIRESKALAYSTYAYYGSPRRREKAHYLQAYVGTQPDKIPDALPALRHIIDHMPAEGEQMENARLSILKKIESDRITPSKLYWSYRANRFRGYERDLREDIYNRLSEATTNDLIDFQHKYVKGRAFTHLILGQVSRLDLGYLEQFGTVRVLTEEDVFGY